MTAPPVPPSPDAVTRLLSVAELLLKVGGVLGMLWAFLARVWKPYQDHRRKMLAMTIREILKPELDTLAEIQQGVRDTRDYEDSCANRLETILKQLTDLFGDHDDLIVLARDNRDRLDETNDLLDHIGFATDRRHPDDVERMKRIIDSLDDRRKRRRRFTDPHPTPSPFPQQERPE